MQTLRQHWPLASKPLPIVIIGAGSIVSDAHLPAYRKAGYPVLGIYDPDLDKARTLAGQWGCKISPMMLALQDAIDQGLIGEVLDFDAWLALDTPWGL